MKRFAICFTAMFVFASNAHAGAVTTINYPGSVWTQAGGISGSNVVGIYSDASNIVHSYLYNGATYNALNAPGAVPSGGTDGTLVRGINGDNAVGDYTDDSGYCHGFLYNPLGSSATNSGAIKPSDISTGTWTTLDMPIPGSWNTLASGISGNNIVGRFNYNTFVFGFLYDGTNWTTLNMPGASDTVPRGISGNNVVGYYNKHGSNYSSGFLYNDVTNVWTTLNMPGASDTFVEGISGNDIVGNYTDDSGSYGFLYDYVSNVWTTPSIPVEGLTGMGSIKSDNIAGSYVDSSKVTINGIDGGNIAGYYVDNSGVTNGFVYNINVTPEPSTIVLLLSAGGLFGLRFLFRKT